MIKLMIGNLVHNCVIHPVVGVLHCAADIFNMVGCHRMRDLMHAVGNKVHG